MFSRFFINRPIFACVIALAEPILPASLTRFAPPELRGTAAGVFNMALSVLMGLVLFMNITMLTIGTFGLGIVCYACLVMPVIQFFVGVGEAYVGYQAMNGEHLPKTRNVAILGIVVAAPTAIPGEERRRTPAA